MPTENRSSNTESKIQPLAQHPEGRRERFQKWVLATKHPVLGYLDGTWLARGDDREGYADKYVQGLWVAYKEFGQPAPHPHPDPIAWMVGTAFWWTKEEAERDAAETGKAITPFGPMTGIAPAEQHQGEPVPITSDMHRLMEAYRLGEFTAEGGSNTIESLAVESFDAVANHGHDADSYMAGFCASLYWQAAPFIGLALKPVTHADPAEVERLRKACEAEFRSVETLNEDNQKLRAQLAELQQAFSESQEEVVKRGKMLAKRDGLLREIRRKLGLFSGGFILRLDETLSASAEPRPFRIPDCPDCACVQDGQCLCSPSKPSAEPSAPVEIDERPEGCCCPPKGYNGLWAAGPCPVHQGLRKLGQARAALDRKPS